jgi:low affinity Fe/Cu permease
MKSLNRWIERLAQRTTVLTGSSLTFLVAIALTIAWLATGPLYDYSDTWQLVMNTFTNIVTFLMVFLLQRSQNKDTMVMQTKLNEIIAALPRASNCLINIENLPEDEVRELHDHYQKLLLRAQLRARQSGGRPVEQVLQDVASREPQRAS